MDIADHIRRDPEEGARRLLSELGPDLYGVALRLVGDERAAADDLYMRALECAFGKIAQYRGDGLFLWLRAILVNIRRMDLRRQGRDPAAPGDEIDLDSLGYRGPIPRQPCALTSTRIYRISGTVSSYWFIVFGGDTMKRGYPEVFRAAAQDAAEVLICVMNDKDAPLSLRVKCAEIILDRGYGKPRQAVEVDAKTAPQVIFMGADRIAD